MDKRIIATFHPQAWVNDYAIEVDPEGETEWDVTDYILASFTPEEALALEDDQYESDNLSTDDPNAPKWIREWSGPFYVEVADSIAEYFETATAYPPTRLNRPLGSIWRMKR